MRGLSAGADVKSTAGCLGQLGVTVGDSAVEGVGMAGLRQASGALDCGNSGTTMRLLAGLLAAQPFESELTGDESLSRRPMDRVVEPLRKMGARAGWPPLRLGGAQPLHGIEYVMPIPSAQVKSSILLAGLYAEGETSVVEPVTTRNHTEVMLRAMGANIEVGGTRVSITRPTRLQPLDFEIPGDLSAASFWLVAAGLLPGSHLRIVGAGLNPTRTALLKLLRSIGFRIETSNTRTEAGEPAGDIVVAPGGELRPVEVTAELAAEMIDELPVLAVAATQLPGVSRITGARELRVKESDRVVAVTEGLTSMGADVKSLDDGWEIRGPRQLEACKVDSHGDHRIAMAMAIAGLMAEGHTQIDGAECVDISYPGFFDQLEGLV